MYTRIIDGPKAGTGSSLVPIVLILVFLNLLGRTLRFGLGFPLFGDEAFVANSFMVRDLMGLTAGLEHYQIVPLLYLWGTFLAAKIGGTSEWVLRSLSFGAGIASVLLFLRIAFLALPLKAALMSLAIFCASYYPVRHAVEVKPYSFDLLVSLCITLAAFEFLRNGTGRSLWFWVLACALGVWASYPAIFVAIGSCLAIGGYGLCRQTEAGQPAILKIIVRPVFIVAVVTTLSFVSMYAWIGSAQRAAGEEVLVNLELWASTFPPWSEPSRLAEWFVHTHLGKMFAYPNGGNNGGSALTFLLFCTGAWAVWKKDRRLTVLVLVSPFPLMLFAASLEAYPYGGSARVAQHVAPAICLLAGAGLSRVLCLGPAPGIEKRALIVVSLFVALILGGMTRDVLKPYKEMADEVNRQVITELAAQASVDEPWIVYGAWGKSEEPVPDLYDWAGSAARFRYYLLREVPERLHWGPGEAELAALSRVPARLLVYRHPYVPFPEVEFGNYLQKLRMHFELAEASVYPFEEGDESLSVYELKPRLD